MKDKENFLQRQFSIMSNIRSRISRLKNVVLHYVNIALVWAGVKNSLGGEIQNKEREAEFDKMFGFIIKCKIDSPERYEELREFYVKHPDLYL